MIEIRTLGETKVYVDGEEVGGEAAWPKSLALIVYMAREPGPDRREDVLNVLWPERDERRARRALNQLLYTLRRTSPELDLESVSGAIDFGKDVWLDVEEFERRLEAGDLKGGVELYGGPFLVDLAFDEPEFSHWADRQRADLRRKFRRAALQLAQEAKDAGDLEAAVGYCQRLLQSDPLDDEVQHLLIECLYRMGNRLGALRQFEKYRGLLERELQVEPLEHTLELIEQIKAEPAVGEEPALDELEGAGAKRRERAGGAASEEAPSSAAAQGEQVPAAAVPAAPRPTRSGLLVVGGLAVVAVIFLMVLQLWPVSGDAGRAGGTEAASGSALGRAGVTTHRVSLSLSADGNSLALDPGLLRVRAGDRIWWVSEVGDEWEIDFGTDGPARQRWLAATGRDSAQAIVRLMAPAGTYSYTAAVKVGDRVISAGFELTVDVGAR